MNQGGNNFNNCDNIYGNNCPANFQNTDEDKSEKISQILQNFSNYTSPQIKDNKLIEDLEINF